MTSKEKTQYLPRSEAVEKTVSRKSVGDWLTVLAFGAISWPWLLRSLSGGSDAEKHALLSRIKLPEDALPNLGSWKADIGFLNLIADEILTHAPSTIVEFGAGATTLVIAQCLKLIGSGRQVSFDEHKDFVEATRVWVREYGLTPEIRHAPLTQSIEGWRGRWYNYYGLPDKIDLLILDGPHWAVHPYVRGAADHLFDRIPVGGALLLDDAARPGERIVARRWRKRWPEFQFWHVNGGTKGTLIGRRIKMPSSF
ncbi:MAG: class I SAM-dependent methyltransferase [Amphiplicatus sp.]